MNIEVKDGEIWYSYMYDLGRDVSITADIIVKALKEDYCLVGLEAPNENIYFKDNEKANIIIASFTSSEYTIENKYIVSSVSEDAFIASLIHFISLYRLAEIHTFSSKYRRDSEYVLLVLSPIYFEAKINGQKKSLILFPLIKITTTGVLIVTFRYSFESIGLVDLIDLENLFRQEIVTVGIPEKIAKAHFHLAALYRGLDPASREYRDRYAAIRAAKFSENVDLFIGTAEGIKFEHIAEGYKYSLIRSLFHKKQLTSKDIQKYDRANYWLSRPVIYLHKFSSQMETATRTLAENSDSLKMILNRVNDLAKETNSEQLIDLRKYEDYLHIMNEAVSVKAYSKTFIDNKIDRHEEIDANREMRWANLQTQVIIDYIHQIFLELKIIEGLLLYSPPITQKELIGHMEALYYKRYLYEADVVYSGELENLIDYAKNVMGYALIEDNIKKNFELRKFKLEVMRNSKIFWLGTSLTLLFGLSNVDRLTLLFYTPMFKILGLSFFFDHPLRWGIVITISLILLISGGISKATKF